MIHRLAQRGTGQLEASQRSRSRRRQPGRALVAAGVAGGFGIMVFGASPVSSAPGVQHAGHVMSAAGSAQPYPIPAPGVGINYASIVPESVPIKRPTSDGTGNFRVVCHYSHMNYDDAVLYPNQPGRAHMHTYFGNLNANAGSTGSSLRSAGNSTCDGGILNRSAYWIPSVINPSGIPVVPDYNMIYYKSGYQGNTPAKIVQTFPIGLKIIAGDMKATAPQGAEPWDRNVNWSCSTESWRGRKPNIPDCPAGEEIVAEIQFPQCWDGKNLDSPDHMSHMAYGKWQGGCPSTHPVALPSISYNIHYKVPAGGTTGWRLSSDMYSGGPGGYSLHADIITAWDPSTSAVWLRNCVRQSADCNVGQITDRSRLLSGVK
jgi:hypothetical protein